MDFVLTTFIPVALYMFLHLTMHNLKYTCKTCFD
jgi:hypothetical protein